MNETKIKTLMDKIYNALNNGDITQEQMDDLMNRIKSKQSKTKVFLGGTCNESTWREELIPLLKIDYFNPVVDNWTEECYKRELEEREKCDICLYVITPKMTGVYSIAEVTDDSNKRPNKTVFCIIDTDGDKKFDKGQLKSLDKVGVMVQNNGGTYVKDFKDLHNVLNNFKK